MPELRQNIITGDWVVVAPERAKRPKDFVIPKSVKVSNTHNCPFCPENIDKRKILADGKTVYAIENKYPAFIESDTKKSLRSFYPEEGFYRAKASVGDHEVIVIKDHDTNLLNFPKATMHEMLEMIRKRYIWTKENTNSVSIMPIYNHGAEAGASLDHPHAQIFSSGIVSNMVGREIEGADRYFGINGECIFCDLIKHEKKEKIRVIAENDDFLAFNFYAPRFPFETWIFPKKHESQFEKTTKTSMENLSDIMSKVLGMIDETLENPPLNLYIHTLPTIFEDSESFHWHLEIAPRVSRFGGFELGSDIIINTMPPEEAAGYLKGKK